MSRSSLRLRLLAAGAAAVLVSVALAALGLGLLFEQHVRRLAVSELSFDLDQLAAGLERAPDGAVILTGGPTDPRFDQPLSGRYWQVEAGGRPLRSRSLWDGNLVLPPVPDAGRVVVVEVPGIREAELLVLERRLLLGDRVALAAVALDAAELRTATRAFMADSAPYLGLLATALILAGWVQVAVGLRPLVRVGGLVAQVRSGAARRLGTDLPEEVQPLAMEVDALIAEREAETQRARSRAADLAHGLKTPLQALIGEADRLRAAGQVEAAAGIEEIAQAMSRHVDRELARARISARSHGVAAEAAPVVHRLLGVLRRTGNGARLDWQERLPEGLRLRIDPDDLTEALGAILENAARHARARVTIAAPPPGGDGRSGIAISDDGPGIPPEHLEALTERGLRLDETGSGLGLAIAREIVEAAGGDLRLRNLAPGLEVTLLLPAVPTEARAPVAARR